MTQRGVEGPHTQTIPNPEKSSDITETDSLTQCTHDEFFMLGLRIPRPNVQQWNDRLRNSESRIIHLSSNLTLSSYNYSGIRTRIRELGGQSSNCYSQGPLSRYYIEGEEKFN
jgi:hypothetical protein